MTSEEWKGVNAMKLGYLMVISAEADAFAGIALVLIPASVGTVFGAMAMERVTEQLFGTALFSFAVVNWFARNAKEGEALRAIVLANLVSNTVGFVLVLLAQLSGVWNAFGWIVVVYSLIMSVGFAYILLAKLTVASTEVAQAQR